MFATSFFEGSKNECNEFRPNYGEGPKQEVIQLKGNKIRKGLVSLECFFDRNDRYVGKNNSQNPCNLGEYEKVNVGDETNPRMINLGKVLYPKRKTFVY